MSRIEIKADLESTDIVFDYTGADLQKPLADLIEHLRAGRSAHAPDRRQIGSRPAGYGGFRQARSRRRSEAKDQAGIVGPVRGTTVGR